VTVLTEEQTILRDQASAWVSEEAPVARFREMRDAGTELGFAEETWKAICDLGWSGILVPEEYGGSGMDCRTFGVVLEETGLRRDSSVRLRCCWAAARNRRNATCR
jgi:alkylation response protein AidB-like acyl-CoA dehydrogenase